MHNYGTPTDHPSGTKVRPLVAPDLDDLTAADLRGIAEARGLDSTGVKKTLIARLRRDNPPKS